MLFLVRGTESVISYPQTAEIVISSPPDLLISPEDTNIILTWDVYITEVENPSWTLIINNNIEQIGDFSNGPIFHFNISALKFEPGTYNLTFNVLALDFGGFDLSAQDTVFVHVLTRQTISVGATAIELKGIPQTTITATVDQDVEITVTPISTPPEETGDAWDELTDKSDVISLSYFFQVNFSDHDAVTNLWLNISYIDWNLIKAQNINETTLKIFQFNETTLIWEPAGNTGVDTKHKVIFANVNSPQNYGGGSQTRTGSTGTGSPSTKASSSITQPTSSSSGLGLELHVFLVIFGLLISKKLKKRKL
jgi:hypothetical protein